LSDLCPRSVKDARYQSDINMTWFETRRRLGYDSFLVP
jgi:hypothetical protein